MHHINNMIVIPLPRKLHENSVGNNHRENCNDIIYSLYGLNISNLLIE